MTPLVLLPGMMCDARLFAPQHNAFCGSRDVSVGVISEHETNSALAKAVLDHAPPRFALAGLSMGGIVAMEIMSIAPERVERLALLDTNPLAEADDRKAIRDRQIADVRAGKLREVIRDEMKPNYLADGPHREVFLDLCLDMGLAAGPEVFIRQSLALRNRPDQTDALRGIDVPTLILCGREDRACPVERHELMHSLIPHSTLNIIDGAGHMPTLEQPKQTTAALARWLEDT